MASSPVHQNSPSSVRKLAFRRACNRVFRTQTSQPCRHGTLTPDYVRQSGLEPPLLPAHSTSNSQSLSPPSQQSVRRPRGGAHSRPLRMLSWDAGHLGTQQWAEIKAWLNTGASASCDLLALQETHWNQTAEITVEGWQCVSSAKKGAPRASKGKAKPRQRRRPHHPAPQEDTITTAEAKVDTGRADGVMLLLSPAIDKKTIRWKEHLKGRLIQASFSWHGARVHVLIAYQHVWSSQKSVHQNKDHLAKLLGSLASALRAIPARDTLLLAGDFNAQLHASQNLVGRSSTPKASTGVRDESFQRFVESHRLVALNTWSSGRGHTYVRGESRTQIDYIFTFPNSSRGQAKQAKPAPHLG